MFCCMKRGKKKARRYKKNSVHPEEGDSEPNKKIPKLRERRMDMSVEELNRFNREVIYCGGCNNPFNLGANALKIHCNRCNRFFHCKIAGKCVGKDCTYNGHTASYCYNCIKRT